MPFQDEWDKIVSETPNLKEFQENLKPLGYTGVCRAGEKNFTVLHFSKPAEKVSDKILIVVLPDHSFEVYKLIKPKGNLKFDLK
jgi:hypothetical protein